MSLSEEELLNLAQPAAPARTKRWTWKRLLLVGLLVVVLVSSVFVGRQIWIQIHLPPQLSVKTFDVPFVPKDPEDFDIDNPIQELHQIITGPDGSLYFLPDFSNWIGRLTPDGSFSRYMISPPEDISFAAWAGLSQGGGSIWATELWGDGIWKLDPQRGTLVNIERMGQSKDYTYNWWNGVATTDGSVWLEVVQNFDFLSNLIVAIGHLDPQTGTLKSYPVAQGSVGWGPLIQATDGTLWIISAVPDPGTPITDSIGVQHFDPTTGAVVNFTITPAFPKFESSEIPLEFPDVSAIRFCAPSNEWRSCLKGPQVSSDVRGKQHASGSGTARGVKPADNA